MRAQQKEEGERGEEIGAKDQDVERKIKGREIGGKASGERCEMCAVLAT